MTAPSTGAGKTAADAFRQRNADFLRRNRRLIWGLSALAALLIIAGVALLAPQSPRTIAGVILTVWGAMTLALVAFVRLPPQWIDNWRIGAEGEQRTAEQLQTLGQHWRTVHDITGWPGLRGNIDHIVAGPGGVYVLDSKCWPNQTVTLSGDLVTVRGTADPRRSRVESRAIGHARHLAYATHEHIRVATRVSTFCTPVLVLWVDPPHPEPTQIAGVWIVPGPALAAWLVDRPAQISQIETDRIWPAVSR